MFLFCLRRQCRVCECVCAVHVSMKYYYSSHFIHLSFFSILFEKQKCRHRRRHFSSVPSALTSTPFMTMPNQHLHCLPYASAAFVFINFCFFLFSWFENNGVWGINGMKNKNEERRMKWRIFSINCELHTSHVGMCACVQCARELVLILYVPDPEWFLFIVSAVSTHASLCLCFRRFSFSLR